MIASTYIPKNEISEWLDDDPSIKQKLSTAYKACIPSLLEPIEFDPRFFTNDHMVNIDFNKEPIFVIGVNKSSHMVISVVYVFPAYRRKGIATYLIEAIKNQYGGIIQVAVESSKPELRNLYEKIDFKTTGKLQIDELGYGFYDYFWGPKPLKLVSNEKGTEVYSL